MFRKIRILYGLKEDNDKHYDETKKGASLLILSTRMFLF